MCVCVRVQICVSLGLCVFTRVCERHLSDWAACPATDPGHPLRPPPPRLSPSTLTPSSASSSVTLLSVTPRPPSLSALPPPVPSALCTLRRRRVRRSARAGTVGGGNGFRMPATAEPDVLAGMPFFVTKGRSCNKNLSPRGPKVDPNDRAPCWPGPHYSPHRTPLMEGTTQGLMGSQGCRKAKQWRVVSATFLP